MTESKGGGRAYPEATTMRISREFIDHAVGSLLATMAGVQAQRDAVPTLEHWRAHCDVVVELLEAIAAYIELENDARLATAGEERG
jgi:hypothetical protein